MPLFHIFIMMKFHIHTIIYLYRKQADCFITSKADRDAQEILQTCWNAQMYQEQNSRKFSHCRLRVI